jgi:hypothetical protein
MVTRNRNAIWPPPPQLALHGRAALRTNSNGTQSAHKGSGGTVYILSSCLWFGLGREFQDTMFSLLSSLPIWKTCFWGHKKWKSHKIGFKITSMFSKWIDVSTGSGFHKSNFLLSTKSKFQFWWPNRNFDFGFDSEIRILILLNFDFIIGISIPAS